MTALKTSSACLVLTLGACGGAPAPEPATPAPAPTPSAAPAAPTASLTASTEAPPPVPEKAKSPFSELVHTESPLALFPLGERLFVRSNNIPLALVEGDRVVEDERYAKGLEGFIGFIGLTGHWSDDAWATIVLTNGRVGWGGLRHWNGQAWEPSGTDLSERWVYAGVTPWVGGQLLALAFNGMPYDTKEPVRFRVVSKSKGGKLPVPTKVACGTLVHASGFTALPSGEVFMAGSTCDDEKLAVEHWAPGQTKGTVERLGGEDPQANLFLLGDKPTSVWLVASTWKHSTLAHFDGQRFEPVESHFEQPVTSASLAPDGTLWLVTRDEFSDKHDTGRVWKKSEHGGFEAVPLPDGFKEAVQVYAAPDGAVWLAADTSLLRSTPPKAAVQTLTWTYDQQFPSGVRVPKLAKEGCTSIFVMMYGITKVTPKDYDFPLTRKAVKGHKELAGARFAETEDNGKRYFGAFVPNLAMGKKLEKLVKDNVKGSKPAVLCNAPRVVRELEINLETGEVVK